MSLSLRFDRALALATDLHRLQLRKGTEVPYIAHLLAVSAIVLEYGGDEDQAIAALLHDAVEDQGGARTLARIRAEFGDRVADIVDACTDTDVVPKPPWKERKEAYIGHLAGVREDALIVSMADKLHNVRSIAADYRVVGEAVWERFSGAREGSLWYYRELVRAFAQRTKGPLLQQLDAELGLLEANAGATFG
jgi:GTP pyrophosphokinase